jgi:protein-tyrosine-phosphatase
LTRQVIFLCTGNAARSVMAGAMLEARRPDVDVITAGTHVVDGQPTSWRTRDALATVGLDATGHRSAQLRARDLPATDVVVAMAGEHVHWMRRYHPDAADRTVTLHRLCRDLGDGDRPLTERLALLDAATVHLEPWEDVADPAGGELPDYVACVRELDGLVARLADRI